MIIEPMTNVLNGSAALPHLGVIRVEGEDAAKFLHGQLTQDFALLGLSEARLAAFCSAKGRVLATFIGFKRNHNDVLLVCSRDMVAAMVKRLSMFVLRAKARVTDATDNFALRGLAGAALTGIGTAPHTPWSRTDVGAATVVFLYPADGVARAVWAAPVDAPLPAGDALATERWLHGEVRSGVATIGAAMTEAFVPQMLNYESVGGVNFKKGCYPGQEVVARSQFRGTLKRRVFQVRADVPMVAGDELFSEADATQPCATVVQAAMAPNGGCDALVSGQVAAFQRGVVRLKAATGPVVSVLALPYPLLDDI